jgi:hypothetical protein
MSLKPDKPNTEIWDRNRGVIRSSKGGWFAGKGVFNHGYDMMRDLVGQVSYMQVILLNATGRLPSREFANWTEAAFICLSWPDPRIWCNQIGALAGTVSTSALSATVAGILSTDSKSYGSKPISEGVKFIQAARKKQQQGYTVSEIIEMECSHPGGKPMMMGYSRPLAKGDERLEAMERTAVALGFKIGEHLSLAYEIEEYLQKHYNESMNINGYVAAFVSDHNYTPEEAYRVGVCIAASGITACYCDTKDKPAGTFLPMQCDDIEYQGKEPRDVPVK